MTESEPIGQEQAKNPESPSFKEDLLQLYDQWEDAYHESIGYSAINRISEEKRNQLTEQAEELYGQILDRATAEMIATKGDEKTMIDIEKSLFYNPESKARHMGSPGAIQKFLKELAQRIAKK